VTDFLNSVLPTQGTYCTVGIRSGVVKQSFYPTIADVDAVSTALVSKGVDAYFALATFHDDSSRKAENAAFLRAFFLDLDCGVGKPYADQPAAAQALSIFIKDTGLPSPTVVNSGGGLHVYWPLTEDVPAAVWLPHAKSLKRLCAQHNLHADPAVTADCVRILRVPGTQNFKAATPRSVQIIAQGQPTDLKSFADLLPPAPVDLSAAKQFGMDASTREIAGGEFPKCMFSRIVSRSMGSSGCAQIKHALVNAATLEEPLWRAALSIAIRCEDGAESIHKLSKAHPGYTASGTEAKAAETKGPYTCQWYKDNNPEGCKGCKQVISSPILIGKIVEEAPVTDDHYVIEKEEDEDSPVVTLAIPAYPYPYFRGVNGGVFRKDRDKDGDDVEVEVYPDDLYLTERFFDSDEHDSGDGEMVGINLHMRKDGVRRFFAPVTTLFATDKLRDLLVRNGVVAYGKKLEVLMAYFASAIRKLQSQYAANRTRNQMGWTPDLLGFVVGELEYTASGVKLAPPASGTRQLAAAFKPTGSLEEWKKIANFYNRPGLEPHALALFFGFGSPLLRLIEGNVVKGAMVHLKHNGSGSGKSTAQMVANSIFGHPDDLLMKKEDTYASKMHMLGMVNSLVFTVDEITNEKAEVLSDMAYGFTSGRGKHRMESQSNRMRANHTVWCNITLTSGNASVTDVLQQYKSTADGELRRVLELSVPKYTGATKQEIDAVFGKLNTNFGVAGPIYIEYVMANIDKVRTLLTNMQAKIDAELGLDQSDRFYSAILTCAFVGALISHRLNLHDIEIPHVYQYALGAVNQARSATKADVGDPTTVAQETLAAFINENVNNALVAPYPQPGGLPDRPAITPKGPLRMRYDPISRELAIAVPELRRFFAMRQVDVKDSVARLNQSGYMKHDGKSHPVRLGAGAVGGLSGIAIRCYVFDGDAIGIDETAFASLTTP
jgi:uncharacterized protein (DUF927 family)